MSHRARARSTAEARQADPEGTGRTTDADPEGGAPGHADADRPVFTGRRRSRFPGPRRRPGPTRYPSARHPGAPGAAPAAAARTAADDAGHPARRGAVPGAAPLDAR